EGPDGPGRRGFPCRPVRCDLGAGRAAATSAGGPAHRLGQIRGVLPVGPAAAAAGRGSGADHLPSIALMRDQVAAARRAGVRAEAISSANATEWGDIERALAADQLDVLLVSPE